MGFPRAVPPCLLLCPWSSRPTLSFSMPLSFLSLQRSSALPNTLKSDLTSFFVAYIVLRYLSWPGATPVPPPALLHYTMLFAVSASHRIFVLSLPQLATHYILTQFTFIILCHPGPTAAVVLRLPPCSLVHLVVLCRRQLLIISAPNS